MECQSLSPDAPALCLANVSVLNLNYQKGWWEVVKDGPKTSSRWTEFKIICDILKIPH